VSEYTWKAGETARFETSVKRGRTITINAWVGTITRISKDGQTAYMRRAGFRTDKRVPVKRLYKDVHPAHYLA
jgi:hypothetical protein